MSVEIESVYNFTAKVINVVDGDTIDVDIDLGFGIRKKTRLRLYGISVPEKSSSDPKEKEVADKVREYLKSHIEGKTVEIQTLKEYGRYFAIVYLQGLGSINQLMVDKGYAVPYFSDHK
jgi:micrococcal nuclease